MNAHLLIQDKNTPYARIKKTFTYPYTVALILKNKAPYHLQAIFLAVSTPLSNFTYKM